VRSVAPAAEEVEHEQEDVEDVEEDARGDRGSVLIVGLPQAVEVDDREATKDGESCDGVDDVAGGDRDEDGDDPEDDQRQQRPEQRAGPRRDVALGAVAVRAEGGDERSGDAGRLPEGGRISPKIAANAAMNSTRPVLPGRSRPR
jgi:hypothetical protein